MSGNAGALSFVSGDTTLKFKGGLFHGVRALPQGISSALQATGITIEEIAFRVDRYTVLGGEEVCVAVSKMGPPIVIYDETLEQARLHPGGEDSFVVDELGRGEIRMYYAGVRVVFPFSDFTGRVDIRAGMGEHSAGERIDYASYWRPLAGQFSALEIVGIQHVTLRGDWRWGFESCRSFTFNIPWEYRRASNPEVPYLLRLFGLAAEGDSVKGKKVLPVTDESGMITALHFGGDYFNGEQRETFEFTLDEKTQPPQ
jgi:hypothetical protein